MKLMPVGEFLKEGYFDPSGMSLQELSDKLGCDKGTLSRLFSGKSKLSYEMAVKLENVWGRKAETWLDHQTRFELQQLKGVS